MALRRLRENSSSPGSNWRAAIDVVDVSMSSDCAPSRNSTKRDSRGSFQEGWNLYRPKRNRATKLLNGTGGIGTGGGATAGASCATGSCGAAGTASFCATASKCIASPTTAPIAAIKSGGMCGRGGGWWGRGGAWGSKGRAAGCAGGGGTAALMLGGGFRGMR